MKGTLSIVDISQKHNSWEIYSPKQEKIGFLSANIVSKVSSSLLRKETLKIR